jgi:hypothetical protein
MLISQSIPNEIPRKPEVWTSIFRGVSFHPFRLIGERRLCSDKFSQNPNPSFRARKGSEVLVLSYSTSLFRLGEVLWNSLLSRLGLRYILNIRNIWTICCDQVLLTRSYINPLHNVTAYQVLDTLAACWVAISLSHRLISWQVGDGDTIEFTCDVGWVRYQAMGRIAILNWARSSYLPRKSHSNT